MNPDENGTVDIADLDNVLASVGVNKTIRSVLSKGADKTDGVLDGKFNLFALRDSSLDHPTGNRVELTQWVLVPYRWAWPTW